MSQPTVHAVWVGNELPLLPRLTLASYVRCGHPVVLHSYKEYDNLPSGVTHENAEKTLPETSIIRHKKSGSLALFSDVFRFRLLQSGADIYSDCDVFCLKPLPKSRYLMGYESDDMINGGLLSLPHDSLLLAKMLELTSNPSFIPPWLDSKVQRRYRMRKWLGFPKHIADMPWGSAGPTALTWYSKETGEDQYALPQDFLYPISYYQVNRLFDPDLDIDDLTTSRTLCIHLYGESLRKHDLSAIPPTSPLGKMLRLTNMTQDIV